MYEYCWLDTARFWSRKYIQTKKNFSLCSWTKFSQICEYNEKRKKIFDDIIIRCNSFTIILITACFNYVFSNKQWCLHYNFTWNCKAWLNWSKASLIAGKLLYTYYLTLHSNVKFSYICGFMDGKRCRFQCFFLLSLLLALRSWWKYVLLLRSVIMLCCSKSFLIIFRSVSWVYLIENIWSSSKISGRFNMTCRPLTSFIIWI